MGHMLKTRGSAVVFLTTVVTIPLGVIKAGLAIGTIAYTIGSFVHDQTKSQEEIDPQLPAVEETIPKLLKDTYIDITLKKSMKFTNLVSKSLETRQKANIIKTYIYASTSRLRATMQSSTYNPSALI